jgi:hypothetical protein
LLLQGFINVTDLRNNGMNAVNRGKSLDLEVMKPDSTGAGGAIRVRSFDEGKASVTPFWPCKRCQLQDIHPDELMPPAHKTTFLACAAALFLSVCAAQFQFGRRPWLVDTGPMVQTEGGELVNEDTVRTARETAPHSVDLPAWTNACDFEKDVFVFTRIIFKSMPGRPSWLGWINDYPDADLNLSARLQQLTSLKTDPDCRVLKLTDPALNDYPFIFMSHPERMELREEEVNALRSYLFNGGALLADDFWGEQSWRHFEQELRRVFPGRSWIELDMTHPLFHCIFDLRGPMNNLQVPTLQLWRRSYDPSDPESFSSAFRGEGSRQMHVRAWLDDQGRIVILALHNSDTGDGWEREGENEVYFHQFSENRAYPLAVNAIFYLMTH